VWAILAVLVMALMWRYSARTRGAFTQQGVVGRALRYVEDKLPLTAKDTYISFEATAAEDHAYGVARSNYAAVAGQVQGASSRDQMPLNPETEKALTQMGMFSVKNTDRLMALSRMDGDKFDCGSGACHGTRDPLHPGENNLTGVQLSTAEQHALAPGGRSIDPVHSGWGNGKENFELGVDTDDLDYSNIHVHNLVADARTRENQQKWVAEMGPWSRCPRAVDTLDMEVYLDFKGLQRPQGTPQVSPYFVTEIGANDLAGNRTFRSES